MSDARQLSEPGVDIVDSQWKMVAEQIPHIVWLASPDGQVEFLNQQARDNLRWPPDGLLERVWEAVHPDDAERVRRAWLHAIDTGTECCVDFRIRHADGEYLWHCVRGLPIYTAEGEVTQWIFTATDIDDHKRSEAALREIGDRLEEAQRLAHVGSWYTDVVTGTSYWSEEMYRLLGFEPGQCPAEEERLHERVHPSDAGTMRAVTTAQTSQSGTREVEVRIVLPGSGLRWLAIRSEPVLGDSDEVVGIHGTAQDVTDRMLGEERLRFQADLLDAVGEAVIATDLTGAVTYWGPGAEDLYGWKAREAEGRTITDLILPVQARFDAKEELVRVARGEGARDTMKVTRRDGSTFTAQLIRTSVLGAGGRLVGVIATSSDVSEREEANAELDRAHRTTAEALTLLATLQEEAPVGFGFVDHEFRFVRLNHELASIIGAPVEDVIGRNVADVVAPDLWERLEPVYRHVLATGEAVRNRPVVGLRDKNGATREWLDSHYPVRVADEIIGIGIIVYDITDRVRSEGFRSTVMSQVVDGVYTEDCNGLLTYMNSAASKLLGWTETELRGKHMHELVHFQNFDGTPVAIDDCALLTQGQRGRLERAGESFTRKDGSTFPVAYSAVPLRVGATVEGVAVIFRDVSEPGSSPNVIRVLIVDADRTATASFRALLDRHEGIDVVAVATTSASALESAERLQPDVVLVNAELPDLDGLATTVAIKAAAPSIRAILMTDKHDETVAVACLEAGCAGVLDKSRAWVDLVSAVRAAYHGEVIISQEELQRVLSKVRGGAGAGRATHLTDREEEVLACMRDGLSNAQVAERLGVTANTVRNHVQRILYKLNVHSKLEAVVLTSRDGLQQGRP